MTLVAGQWTAYFRGRRLEGHEVDLPAGVIGLVAHETAATAVQAEVETTPNKPYLDDLLEDEDEDEYAGIYVGGGGFADLAFGDDDDGGCDHANGGVHAGQKRPREEEQTKSSGKGDVGASLVQRNWAVDGSFNRVLYWLHDRPAGDGDVLLAAVEWIAASKALHAQVTAEDVAVLGH